MNNSQNFILAFCLYFFSGCSGFECENKIVSTVVDPHKIHAATVMLRDCGATTDYVTIVLVHSAGLTPDYETDPHVVVIKGNPKVILQWKGYDQLVVHAPTVKLFSRINGWRSIKITLLESNE